MDIMMNFDNLHMPFAVVAFFALGIERVRLCKHLYAKYLIYQLKRIDARALSFPAASLQLLLHLHRPFQEIRGPKQNSGTLHHIERWIVLAKHAKARDLHQSLPVRSVHL